MAWYKWLDEDMYDPVWEVQWPQIGETQTLDIDNLHKGYHVYPGSGVCTRIPWRNMPADLYLVEPDGEYVIKDGQVFFTEVTPVEKIGTLKKDAAAKLAVAWLDKLLEFRFDPQSTLQPELSWNAEAIRIGRDRIAARLRGSDDKLLPSIRNVGDKAIIYTAAVVEAKTPDEAWCYALYLADEASSPKLGLEFAKVMDRVIKGEI